MASSSNADLVRSPGSHLVDALSRRGLLAEPSLLYGWLPVCSCQGKEPLACVPKGLAAPHFWVRAGALCHFAKSRFANLVMLPRNEKTSRKSC